MNPLSTSSKWAAWAGRTDILETTCRLTLLLFLLHNFKETGQGAVIQTIQHTLAAAGLVCTPLLRSKIFWGSITALFAFTIYRDSGLTDNHIYLSTYWAAVLFLSTWQDSNQAVRLLRANSRYFLVACMAIAVIWKLLASDYRSGAFFHMCLLTDDHFMDIARATGPLTGDALEANRLAFKSFWSPTIPLSSRAPFESNSQLATLAIFLTWWTVVIEALIAALWVFPARWQRIRTSAHAILMIFCLSTYLFLPVVGFGQLLLIFGYVTCEQEHHRTRLAYLLTILGMELYTAKWMSFLV